MNRHCCQLFCHRVCDHRLHEDREACALLFSAAGDRPLCQPVSLTTSSGAHRAHSRVLTCAVLPCRDKRRSVVCVEMWGKVWTHKSEWLGAQWDARTSVWAVILCSKTHCSWSTKVAYPRNAKWVSHEKRISPRYQMEGGIVDSQELIQKNLIKPSTHMWFRNSPSEPGIEGTFLSYQNQARKRSKRLDVWKGRNTLVTRRWGTVHVWHAVTYDRWLEWTAYKTSVWKWTVFPYTGRLKSKSKIPITNFT